MRITKFIPKITYFIISFLLLAACSDDSIQTTSPTRTWEDSYTTTRSSQTTTSASSGSSIAGTKIDQQLKGTDFVAGEATGCCGTGCTISCEDAAAQSFSIAPKQVRVDPVAEFVESSAFYPGDAESCCGTGCKIACE